MAINSEKSARTGKEGSSRILDPRWDGRSTFTVAETAEIFGVSRCSAYAAVKKGEIPVIWIGRRCIVPRHAPEKLLATEVRGDH